MMSDEQKRRLQDIADRCRMASSSPWRNTIRRDSPEQVASALKNTGGLGVAQCSEVVVNTPETPKVGNVICWMGPAAGKSGAGDDLHDAAFIANARDDVPWLLELVKSLQGDAG